MRYIDQLDLANRPRQLWAISILLAVVLNIFLFLSITFLTGLPQEIPDEDFRIASAVRLLGSMGTNTKKEPVPPEPEPPKPEQIKPIEKVTPVIKEQIIPSPTPSSVPASTSEPAPSSSSTASSASVGSMSGSASGTVDAGDLDGALIPISRKPPVYPAEARRREIEGAVRVRIIVDERGRVESAEVVWARPEGVFEKNALACAKEWRFQAPRKNGRPVRARAESTLRFSLED